MAEARSRDEWERTSTVIAFTINGNPFRTGRPVQAAAFNPWTVRTPVATVRAPLSMLCSAMLVRRGYEPLPIVIPDQTPQ
jgi:hypothetical protein